MPDEHPARLPLFPLSRGVLPGGMLLLNIFEVRYLDLIRRCHREGTPFGVAWLAEGSEVQVPGQVPRLYPMGCTTLVRTVETLQPAVLRIRCQGISRFLIEHHEAGPLGVWQASVHPVPDDPELPMPEALTPVAARLGQLIAEAQQQGFEDRLPIYPPYRLDDCGWVANRLAELLPLPAEAQQALLAEADPAQRLARIAALMAA